jgi:hypothetical protein
MVMITITTQSNMAIEAHDLKSRRVDIHQTPTPPAA